MTVNERDGEWDRIARQYRRLVLREARRILRDKTSAEDVAQEVLLALWRCDNPPETADHLRNWLCRAARNAAISRNRLAVLPVVDGIAPDQLPDAAREGPEPELEALLAAIALLPEPYAESLRLRYVAGLEVPQIAAAMAVPHETVRTRLRRGAQRLKRSFAPPHAPDQIHSPANSCSFAEPFAAPSA